MSRKIAGRLIPATAAVQAELAQIDLGDAVSSKTLCRPPLLPNPAKLDSMRMVIGAQRGPTSARKRGPPRFRGTLFGPGS